MRKTHWEVYNRLIEENKLPNTLAIPVAKASKVMEQVDATARWIVTKRPKFLLPYINHIEQFDRRTQLTEFEGIILPAIFKSHGAQIYKIGREFGEQLRRVKLNISSEHIPLTDGVICIELPDTIRFPLSPGEYMSGGIYIYVEELLNIDGKHYKRLVMFTHPVDENAEYNHAAERLAVTFYENENIDAALRRNDRRGTVPLDAWHYLLNCLLYIHSGKPDLRSYRAPKIPERSGKDRRRALKENADKSLVDMTLVGYDFLKSRVYSVSQTQVTAHWRRYEKGRSQVKLVWIDEHTRRFGVNDE